MTQLNVFSVKYYHIVSDDSYWSTAGASFVAGESIPPDVNPETEITDLPNLDELRVCLRFYKLKLGELATPDDRAAEIRAELNALDEEYLTPRVLAGLATGDEYALGRLAAHEERAVPLRAALAEITGEK